MADLPENCPPPQATSVEGTYYRFAAPSHRVGTPTVAEDWVAPHAKAKGECAGRTDRCDCHAHSILSDLAEALNARELMGFFKRKSIAKVTIEADQGVVAATPVEAMNSHHDWWPEPADFVPDAEVVEAGR